MRFNKILVANRGEIAIRVMRACRELGIRTVAVFSEVDRTSKHVRYADEAFEIGPAPSVESYLKIDRIIETAKLSGCQAIHPGYGFLAENPDLPRACEREDIIFIGPSSESMALVADKTEARKTVIEVGIPVIPGLEKPVEDIEEAVKAAEIIGYPIMIKAAAGGGGKGVRVVHKPVDLRENLELARAEAQSAFNNPSVYLERYLIKPRHVEIQILADHYGNIIHLNERECSVQRRYQKLIEESPSCIMDEDLRLRMCDAAIRAIRASGYTNAGTVEFLVDNDRNFYFCEVNARLQVEHPVTELITGIDLVKQQISIAAGNPLSIRQDDIQIYGAAIECRVSAEDPVSFMPSTGHISEVVEPAGPGIRVESGIYEGYDVTVYYDPLLAKVITWGSDRKEALARMDRALEEYKIKGIKTTIPFHQKALRYKPFIEGNYNTGIVEEIEHQETDSHIEIAAVAAAIVAMADKPVSLQTDQKKSSRWKYSGRSRDDVHRHRR